jgi:hypothetical protein
MCLFFAHVISTRKARAPARRDARPSMLLALGIFVGAVSTMMLPLSLATADRTAFNMHLLCVHAVLLVPVLFQRDDARQDPAAHGRTAQDFKAEWQLLVAGVSVWATFMHWTNLYRALSQAGLPATLRAVLENDCQTSITTDVFTTSLAVAIYAQEMSGRSFAKFWLEAALWSPATATALALFA